MMTFDEGEYLRVDEGSELDVSESVINISIVQPFAAWEAFSDTVCMGVSNLFQYCGGK